MKKVLSLILSLAMLSGITAGLGISAYAASQEWECGTEAKAVFDGNSTLTVSGTGAINDYASVYDTPWSDMSINFKIQTLVIENGITAIGARAFSSLLSLQNVTIAPTVISIGERAFSGSRMITSIDIPASVEFIGEAAFRTASTSVGADLTAINVDPNNNYYTSIDGILYDKNVQTLIQIPSSTAVTELVIPDTVKTINSQAGVNCQNLEKVVVSDGVTELVDLTFAKCSLLKEIVIPQSVSVISINALQNCNSLEKIVIAGDNCLIPDGAIPNASGVTVYGIEGSTAQQYAESNGIAFIPVSVDTLGGSIRVNETPGLRFGFSYNNALLEQAEEYGFIYSYSATDDLTFETEGVKTATADKRINHGDYTTFNLVFVDMPGSAFNQMISARAYVKIHGTYFYSDVLQRSFRGVANAALADDTLSQETKDKINDMLNA